MAWVRPVVAACLRTLDAVGPRAHRRALRLTAGLPAAWHRGDVANTRIAGFHLALQLDDNVQRELYYLGAYERPFVRYLVDELRPGDVVLDVGAHVGIFTLPLARRLERLGAGRVIAVEAASSTASRLRDHVSRNGLDDRVQVLQAALAAQETEVALHSDPFFGAGDSAVRSQYGTGEVVETARGVAFDEWAEPQSLGRLDVVKLDIEGAELAALQGMAGTLTRLRPRLVTVECKAYVLDRAGTSEDEVDALMASLGYARQAPLSRLLGVRAGLPHVDDNVLYRPASSSPGS